jgi:hypothetical protein
MRALRRLLDVGYLDKADMAAVPSDVCFRGKADIGRN